MDEKTKKGKAGLLILWVMTGGVLILFPFLLHSPFLLHWDQVIYDWGREHRNPGVVLAMRGITPLGSTTAVIVFSLIFMAVAYGRGLHWKTLWIAVGALALRLGNWGLKHWIHRPRPDSSLGFAFPSGHAGNIALMAFFAFWIFGASLSRNLRIFLGLFLVFLALAVGISRIVLEVHWFSDVISGYLFGIWIACGITLLDRSSSAKAG